MTVAADGSDDDDDDNENEETASGWYNPFLFFKFRPT